MSNSSADARRRREEAEEVAGLDLFATAEETAPEPTRRNGLAKWIFLAAAVVVVVLVITMIVNWSKGGGAAENASATVASKVRGAHDAKTVSASAGTGDIKVVYSASEDAFAVRVRDVAKAPKGQVYQVSVTHDDSGQSFERVGLIGAEPKGQWSGYRGVKDILSVHLTLVAKGGEDAPEEPDLADVALKQKK